MAQLTPLIMMAAEGLMQNDALQRIPLKTGEYTSQTIVADYLTTLAAYQAGADAFTPKISQATVDDFQARLDATAPYISNRPPAGSGTDPENYTTILDQHIENLFPAASATNNQEFVQYALISMGQKDVANQWINSANNGATLASQTFTDMDALMSGNITAISTNPHLWGQELIDTGTLLDFKRIDILGTPHALLEALMRVNMLSSIGSELEAQGLDVRDVQKAVKDNPEKVLKPVAQKRCYDAFEVVTGDRLLEILFMLGISTAGIGTLADLLDLTKIFPRSVTTITAPFDGAVSNIYLNPTTLSPSASAIVPSPTSVVPEIIAKANTAFRCSLSQVKNIMDSTPQRIGTAAMSIEGNDGLAVTGSLTTALPAASSATIKGLFPGGSGPDDTFYLTDFIGGPAALPFNANFDTLNANFNTVQTAGGFDEIALVLQVMRDVLGGTSTTRVKFSNPSNYRITIFLDNPGEGVYTDPVAYDYQTVIDVLLLELDTAVANYIAAYSTNHSAMTAAYDNNAAGVVGAIKTLWEANVRFQTTFVTDYQTGDPEQNGLPAQQGTTLAFAENLPAYGNKTSKNDIAEILEAMARKDTQGGNAIIAAMREGRNAAKLDAADVKADNIISDQPATVEPGNIS